MLQPQVSQPRSHQFVEIPAVPGDCAHEGTQAGFRCSICGTLFDSNKKEVDQLPSSGFDSNAHNYVASWNWDDEDFELNTDKKTINVEKTNGKDNKNTVTLTVTCANGCGDTITRTVNPKIVDGSLVRANCDIKRDASADYKAEIVIDEVKYTDTHHVVVPYEHSNDGWVYRKPSGQPGEYTSVPTATGSTQHRHVCTTCGTIDVDWEDHELFSLSMVKDGSASFQGKCACELKFDSEGVENLQNALSTATNNHISRVIVDKEYPEINADITNYKVGEDVTLVIEKPLTVTSGYYALITVAEGGHLDVNTVVGENIIVKDENTKTVNANVNDTKALDEVLKLAATKDYTVNVVVDEKVAETAVTLSESSLTVEEGTTLNLVAGDLAKESEAEYIAIDASSVSSGIENKGTLNIKGIELTGNVKTGDASPSKDGYTAKLDVENSLVTGNIEATEGTVVVNNSVINASTDAVKVTGKNVKVNVTDSTLGNKKENKKGNINVADVAEKSSVTVRNTEVVGTIKLDAVASKLDVTGGSLVSSGTDSAISSSAKTKKSKDAVTVSLDGVEVKADKTAVALYFVSGGTYTVSNSTVTGGTGIQALNGTVDVKGSTITATGEVQTSGYAVGTALVDGAAVSLIGLGDSGTTVDNTVFNELSFAVDSASKLTVNGGEHIFVYVDNTTLGVTDIAVSAEGYEISKNHGIIIDDQGTKLAKKHNTDNDPLEEVVLTINGEVYDKDAE